MSAVAVFAHRGAFGSHPENTAAAFGEALRLGVEAIEFDVRMSRGPTDDRLSRRDR